ncbi:hypothetical protein BS50DRAFT_620332 [Corynespora cassiicola Philippines]|uniref:PARP catalytic domain-containing protein n=1 Tax=Corynespora cassiicola Philippines TaxID=1448308 RepID=A0A2T2NR82_CORCC|nr:hypothetical protein BS50DRAFT_620332 [Corynespora cassiicola Philippines]
MERSEGIRFSTSWTKNKIFNKIKPSDEWRQQINFTAGLLHPSDENFPWALLQKHTNDYLRKKGKLSQAEMDVRLHHLIDSITARDVAIAACAYAMSSAAVRAILNVELQVAPASFYGLRTYLESLIAANGSNIQSITSLEALWARKLLPYAVTHGTDAAGQFLQGISQVLLETKTTNMSALPDFLLLTRRAVHAFSVQLEGYRLKCEWAAANKAKHWMSVFANSKPTNVAPNRLLINHFLDSQFHEWRVWANWTPYLERIILHNSIEPTKRGILPDLLALEGPDFITGQTTLREGVIFRYKGENSTARFQSLSIQVVDCSKTEFREMLDRVAEALDGIVAHGIVAAFDLFIYLLISGQINRERLEIMEAMNKITSPIPTPAMYNAVQTLFHDQKDIDGGHIEHLTHLIPLFDYQSAEQLRAALLKPWMISGMEKCLLQCQDAVREHISMGKTWTKFSMELHKMCMVIKESKTVYPLLNVNGKVNFDKLPSREMHSWLIAIYDATGNQGFIASLTNYNPIKESIEAYVEGINISHAHKKTVDAILNVWKNTEDPDRRQLAIVSSRCIGTDFVLRCRCFEQATKLSEDLVKKMLEVFMMMKKSTERGIMDFASLLASLKDQDIVDCWKSVLYIIIEDLSELDCIDSQLSGATSELVEYTLSHLRSQEWHKSMQDIITLFGKKALERLSKSLILQKRFYDWVLKLSEYIPAITELEKALGNDGKEAVACLLRGGVGHNLHEGYLVQILDALKLSKAQPCEYLVQCVAGQLRKSVASSQEISKCVGTLINSSSLGVEACRRIWNSKQDQDIPTVVSEVRLAGWLRSGTDLIETDRKTLKSLAAILELELLDDVIPVDKIKKAARYFEEEEEKLAIESSRLASIVQALRYRDPQGTAILLDSLGIKDNSLLDEDIASLPADIFKSIERLEDNVIEMRFPLPQNQLQCNGLGIEIGKTLCISLILDYTGDVPPTFCVHLDGDVANDPKDGYLTDHTPWVCFEDSNAPDKAYCREKLSPLTYHINRKLHRYFQSTSDFRIADIYTVIKKDLNNLPHYCMVCDQSHKAKNVQLHRPHPCNIMACAKLWSYLPIDVRIPEIRTDTFAVDMLLTGVYVAAMTGQTELLPGCPITSTSLVTGILNTLPSTSVLKDAINLSATLRACHKDAESLISWSCTHFRGYIATASGTCRIPSLASSVHQFVLANASPRMENSFASKLPTFKAQTRILFHGTSLDRLPSILAQGLRVKSGTALQRTGAAHGKGIYLAEDPATSFTYSPAAISWRNSGLSNVRLLLGCEVAGNGRSVGSGGIHVITDEQTVMVRFVWLFGNGAYTPASNHVLGPMQTACVALRNGKA